MRISLKILFLVLLSFPFLCGCNQDSNSQIDFAYEKKLKGKEINIDNEIGDPTKLFIDDSIMIILDYYKEYNLCIINIDSGNIVKRFGKKGNGPNEMQHATSISFNKEHNNIEVFDTSNRKLFYYNIDSLLGNKLYSPKVEDFRTLKFTPYHLKSFYKKTYISTGDFENFRFKMLTLNKTVSNFGEYPELSDEKIPKSIYSLVFQGNFLVNTDIRSIVSCSYKFPLIEFYSVKENDQIILEDQYFECEPKVEVMLTENFQSVSSMPNNKYGFLDLYGTSKYIYALYSGRMTRNYKEKVYASDKVLVFDWLGHKVIKFNIDRDINCLAVSEDDQYLYGFDLSHNISLLEYKLEF